MTFARHTLVVHEIGVILYVEVSIGILLINTIFFGGLKLFLQVLRQGLCIVTITIQILFSSKVFLERQYYIIIEVVFTRTAQADGEQGKDEASTETQLHGHWLSAATQKNI